MLKNFDNPILGIDDKPLMTRVNTPSGPQEKPTGFADTIVQVLLDRQPGDEALEPDKKTAMFSLAKRVTDGGPREYTPADLELIKTRCNKVCTVLFVARLVELCDKDDLLAIQQAQEQKKTAETITEPTAKSDESK